MSHGLNRRYSTLHQKIHRAITTERESVENKVRLAPRSHHHHLCCYSPHPLVFKTSQLGQLLFTASIQ